MGKIMVALGALCAFLAGTTVVEEGDRLGWLIIAGGLLSCLALVMIAIAEREQVHDG